MGILAVPFLVLLKRILLVANPASRKGASLVDSAQIAIVEAGATCDVLLTERPGHAREISTARHHEYDAVFTLGGDGTAMEVASALAYTGVPVGVLQGGTGNLLARAIGIPANVPRAVRALMLGHRRQIDLGVVHGHRFAVAAGVGIDASMVEHTPRWMKRRLGVLAYTLMATRAALRTVLRNDPFMARVEIDGEIIERKAALVMFANFGAILENRISFGANIESDDGILDCCIFSPESMADALRVLWRITMRDFRPDKALLYRKGTHFRLQTVPPLALQADGELLGRTPAEITVEPLAATLLVPGR